MRRRLALGVVAAVAASVWAAPAANAQVTRCTSNRLPGQTIVVISPGQIDIFPQNAGPYANDVLDWANGIVDCIVDEVREVLDPFVTCAEAYVANRPTVTIDPQTLQITIRYADFINTTCQLG
jgi:hypothetical protein